MTAAMTDVYLCRTANMSWRTCVVVNSLRPNDAYICVSELTIIGSDNGLSPDRRQAIIWTNTGVLLIGPLGTNFTKISIEILTFSFKKMRLKVSSAKRWPFCLGLNVLIKQMQSNPNHRSAPGGPIFYSWWRHQLETFSALRIELTYQLSNLSFSRNFHVLLS